MSFDLHLNGLRAVVTGGTLGLGAAVVKALAEAGARVVTSARTVPAERVEGVTYVAADLSTAEGTSQLAQTVLKDWGGRRHLDQRARWLEDSRWRFRCDQ